MKGWRFFRRRGFLVGVLVAGLISIFGMVKNADAIGTQTNISTRPDQSASSSASDCYTNSTPGYEWNTGKTCDEGDLITVEAETGSSYYMTFSHNFKTDSAGVSVDCKVTISKPSGDDTKYKLSNAGGGNYSYGLIDDDAAKECNATTGSGGAVSDSNRPYTDGKYNYIHRDFLRVKFFEAGKYEFCENIKAGANGYSAKTKGCIKYIITDGGSSHDDDDDEEEEKKYEMTVIARDVDGNKLNKSNSKESSDELCAKDIGKWSITGYKLKGYTTDSSGSTGLEDSFCRSMTRNYTVYAVYENELSFIGKSDVNSLSTGFIKENSNKLLELKNCSFTEGCIVTFKHYLKKDKGDGTTSYNIDQASSYDSKTTTITSSGSMSNSSSGGNGNSPIYTSEVKIYPGMLVCQTFEFGTNGTSDSTATLRVCAVATGITSTSLGMMVKNKTLETKYEKEVYAKPGDEIIYKANYNPAAQYAYEIPVHIINVDGKERYNKKLGSISSLRNSYLSTVGIGDWNNAFSAFGENFSKSFGSDEKYTNGKTSEKEKEYNYTVDKTEVGKDKVLKGVAKTNVKKGTSTVPKQVTFTTNEKGQVVLSIDTSSIEGFAHVYVPYNFKNTIEITKIGDVGYAGETKAVQFKVDTVGKTNLITSPNNEYIAFDDSPIKKVAIQKCINGTSCGNFEEIEDNKEEYSITVPDVKAGTEICVKVGVYPSNSGADNNWNNPEGSGEWAYSEPKCFTVAKKPSIQVWGGSMFSNGRVDTPLSKKKCLAGYNDDKEKCDGKYAFGSWTELGLVSNGSVTGFGSGAGLGYASIADGVVSPFYHPDDGAGNNGKGLLPGGADKFEKYCDITTLSFANNKCNTFEGGVGNLGSDTEFTDRTSLIENLIDRVQVETSSKIDGAPEFKDDEKTVLIRSDDSVPASGDITITGNIELNDSYDFLVDVPKIFIYANNIKINCDVERIDAVLIAEGAVNTCPTDFKNTEPNQGINSPGNSVQLKINGTIIANELIANRTYGAATGANSIIPAEIINYDSTLYLWGQKNINLLNTGELETTYQTELAPRY